MSKQTSSKRKRKGPERPCSVGDVYRIIDYQLAGLWDIYAFAYMGENCKWWLWLQDGDCYEFDSDNIPCERILLVRRAADGLPPLTRRERGTHGR